MSNVKKLGKGLDDISYLFLSTPEENSAAIQPVSQSQENSVRHSKATLKSICVLGDNYGFQNAFLVVNLSIALARLGMQITLLDLNEELSCLNFFLGREIKNEEFKDQNLLIYKGPMGIKLVSLNKNILRDLRDQDELKELSVKLAKVEVETDLILINLSQNKIAGVIPFLASFVKEFLILVPPDKNNMLNAYRNIKFILQKNLLAKIGLVVTEIEHMYEIDKVFAKMSGAVEKFLNKELYKYGFLFKISQDMAPQSQIPSYYDADLTACISNIAQIIVLRSTLNESVVARRAFFETIIDNLG